MERLQRYVKRQSTLSRLNYVSCLGGLILVMAASAIAQNNVEARATGGGAIIFFDEPWYATGGGSLLFPLSARFHLGGEVLYMAGASSNSVLQSCLS